MLVETAVTTPPRRAPRGRRAVALLAAAAVLGVGVAGTAGYVRNYWLYRGFGPPVDPGRGPARLAHHPRLPLGRAASRRPVRHLPAARLPGPGRPRAPFPALYLLGSPAGVPQGIFSSGATAVRADELIHRHRMRPMIIVVPRANTGLFGNDHEWADASAGRYESFVLETVRYVDRHFATIASRAGRGVGGLSMGGYGAANIAVRHPGFFSVVESWSGYFVQTHSGPFAHASRAWIAANSPLREIRVTGARIRRLGLHAWVYQGTHDDVHVRDTLAFVRALRDAGAQVRFAVYPGGHDWRLWRSQIPRQLLAASAWLAPPRGGGR